MALVFLGGTCGVNEWRKERAIPRLLALGVSDDAIFDPVVDDWNEQAQANEDRVKRDADVLLFHIAAPGGHGGEVSAYSLVEAVMALYDDPRRTVVSFDTTGMSPHVVKATIKIARDLRQRFPEGRIFDSLPDALECVALALLNTEAFGDADLHDETP